nr:hypothetical protein [uncultured Prevotella sp.]
MIMKRTFFICLCLLSVLFVHAQSSLGALQRYIQVTNERYDTTLSYMSGIEKYYGGIINQNHLTSKAVDKLTTLKDESLKRIKDKAEFGDYSRAVDVAEYEYKTVTVAMANVVKQDIDEQNELARKEQQRIYEYTHPFDNFSYAKYSKVINNPSYESKSTHIQIAKIALSPVETRVEFKVSNVVGEKYFGWVSINPNTYIYIPSLKRKIKLTAAQNIAISPSTTDFHFANEELVFALVFPALPVNVRNFNLIESESSSWKFYNIRVK